MLKGHVGEGVSGQGTGMWLVEAPWVRGVGDWMLLRTLWAARGGMEVTEHCW